jgi:hypothetical protein
LAALETHLADLRPRRFTLHGADIDLASDPIRIRREAADPRNPPPIVTLDPGHSIVWDRRWRITLCDHAPSRVTVSALGLDGLARLTASGFERDPGVPAYTLGSLPALCTSARADMVAVPVLDWFAPPWQPMHVCAELVGFEIG